MTNIKQTKSSVSRRLGVAALLAVLTATGGVAVAQQQPDRAPSTGDTIPRCC